MHLRARDPFLQGTLWGIHGRAAHNLGTGGSLRESLESPCLWAIAKAPQGKPPMPDMPLGCRSLLADFGRLRVRPLRTEASNPACHLWHAGVSCCFEALG